MFWHLSRGDWYQLWTGLVMPLGQNRGSNLEFFVCRASGRITHVKMAKLVWGPREEILARVMTDL